MQVHRGRSRALIFLVTIQMFGQKGTLTLLQKPCSTDVLLTVCLSEPNSQFTVTTVCSEELQCIKYTYFFYLLINDFLKEVHWAKSACDSPHRLNIFSTLAVVILKNSPLPTV